METTATYLHNVFLNNMSYEVHTNSYPYVKTNINVNLTLPLNSSDMNYISNKDLNAHVIIDLLKRKLNNVCSIDIDKIKLIFSGNKTIIVDSKNNFKTIVTNESKDLGTITPMDKTDKYAGALICMVKHICYLNDKKKEFHLLMNNFKDGVSSVVFCRGFICNEIGLYNFLKFDHLIDEIG